MKIGRISTNQNYINNNNKKQKNNVAFKGNIVATFERTPVLNLLFIDLLGMILPRTIIDLLRNRKELKHLNYDAGRETFLREISAAFFMYFMPVIGAVGLGNLAAKSHYAKKDVNTKLFMGCDFIQASQNKLNKIFDNNSEKLKSDYIDGMLENLASFTKKSKMPEAERKQIADLILNVDKTNKKEVQKIADKIKVLIGEESRYSFEYTKTSRVNKQLKEKAVKLTGSVDDFVNDLINFSDNFIEKGLKEGSIGHKAICKINDICKNTIKFNKIKTGVAVGFSLAALIAFPRINIYITKKLSKDGTGNFPGLNGLNNQATPEDKKGVVK